MTERQRVVRTDQSPVNPKQWCLTLACGHDVWVTSKARPKRKTEECTEATCTARKVGGLKPAYWTMSACPLANQLYSLIPTGHNELRRPPQCLFVPIA